MDIVLVRVDDRLIHGQILESWIPFLKAQCVVVANDALAGDQFQRAILSMAIPDRITLRIVPVDEARNLLDDPELNGMSTLTIVASVMDAFRLHQSGVTFPKLNIGNVKGGNDLVQLSFSVWISRAEVLLIKALLQEGYAVNLQSVPREREIDVQSVIDTVEP